MSKTTILNHQFNYYMSGEGQDVILLHGWGQNIEMMMPLHQHLEKTYRVWTIDFPGFGESEMPQTPYNVDDYAAFLHAFVEVMGIINPTLIGHSFGGRVAIVYANHYPTHKLVLMDAAGIRPKRTLPYYLRIYTYKVSKRLIKLPFFNRYETHLASKAGSSDYRQLNDEMKKTFIKVVNQDLTSLLSTIKQPTLIIWGAKDDATPLAMGQLMEKKIPNAGLIVFEHAGHYAYLECLPQVLAALDIFLKEGL